MSVDDACVELISLLRAMSKYIYINFVCPYITVNET